MRLVCAVWLLGIFDTVFGPSLTLSYPSGLTPNDVGMLIRNGERPKIPDDTPAEYANLLEVNSAAPCGATVYQRVILIKGRTLVIPQEMWAQNPRDRPSAAAVLEDLQLMLRRHNANRALATGSLLNTSPQRTVPVLSLNFTVSYTVLNLYSLVSPARGWKVYTLSTAFSHPLTTPFLSLSLDLFLQTLDLSASQESFASIRFAGPSHREKPITASKYGLGRCGCFPHLSKIVPATPCVSDAHLPCHF